MQAILCTSSEKINPKKILQIGVNLWKCLFELFLINKILYLWNPVIFQINRFLPNRKGKNLHKGLQEDIKTSTNKKTKLTKNNFILNVKFVIFGKESGQGAGRTKYFCINYFSIFLGSMWVIFVFVKLIRPVAAALALPNPFIYYS